jgi:Fur family transcriptional regulator, ferric uptake regulator
VVRRVAANDEFARFELVEELTEHRHHLLCTGGGKVIDITPSPAFERTRANQLDARADAEGFAPHSHRVDVVGLCHTCQ